MKSLSRSILILAIAALLSASAGLRSDAATRGAPTRAFDGVWSVVINTLRGDCGRSLRYSVRIVGGRVQTEDPSYQLAGMVAPNGSIRVEVAEKGRSASGFGKLTRETGHGQWRTTTGECAGLWTAERRHWED